MKHEWRKKEKAYYVPGNRPVRIRIPEFGFYSIEGQGNPNDDAFPEYISALYSLSYAVRMSPKKGLAPKGYYDYTVYPLEGVWDIREEAKDSFTGRLDKDDLVFNLMIRQPDFVDEVFAMMMLEQVKKSRPHALLSQVKFEKIADGESIQMMHHGSYDDEPESFRIMEAFAAEADLHRVSKVHREIYLTDARKVEPEKLKTVLRFKVENK
jgi:hypothetical protein